MSTKIYGSTDPGADIIDFRDITARVEALRDARESFIDDCTIHTSCQFCGQDIEGDRAGGDWRDRGGSRGCAAPLEIPEPDTEHEPSDEALSDTAYERGRWADEHPDDAEELARLEKLLEETGGYGGDHQWNGTWYPGSMIADSYFEDYARELADDIGAINRNATWPVCHIDWEAAADSLKQDYASITYGGVEYWYR